MRRRLLTILVLVLLISACGQKGPLFRPGHAHQAAPANSLAGPR